MLLCGQHESANLPLKGGRSLKGECEMSNDDRIRAVQAMEGLIAKPLDRHLVRDATLILFRESGSVCTSYDIRQCCLQAQDWEEVAAVTVGVTSYHPPAAGEWIEEQLSPLLHLGEDFTPSFAFGSILGFFRIGLWLCDNWRNAPESFWMKWPSLYQGLALSPRLKMLPSDNRGVRLPDSKYGGELNNAVRSFLSSPRCPEGNRFFKCYGVCDEVNLHAGSDTYLTPMGRVLLDFATYHLFSKLTAYGRAEMLSEIRQMKIADGRRHAKSSQTG